MENVPQRQKEDSVMKKPTITIWLLLKYSCISSNVSTQFTYLTHMSLFLVEKNPQLVKLYKDKMGQYMSRAEYIKKTVLDKPPPESTGSGGGGGAAAQAKK